MHNSLPFPALVGLEFAQQALMLLAIEPRLRGVVLAAPAGTGKSSLARGMAALFAAHDDADEQPFVEIPASIDAESLLGGLDLEATLHKRRMVIQRGVLARAHGGLAYVDGINLLTDASTNILLKAMDDREIRIEREGISTTFPADFSLIGSYDPSEGQPRQHLLDRVGLMVTLPGQLGAKQRATVVENNLRGDVQAWQEDSDFLRGLILTAREQLPHVTISEHYIQQLSATALQYGVEGHRADLFAVWAACAAAAYDLRDEVDDDDVLLAAKLVILPRATVIPSQEPDAAPPPEQQQQQNPPEQPPENQQPPESSEEDDDSTEQMQAPTEIAPQPEQILEALESQLPDVLDELPFRTLRKGRAGSRGSTAGTRGRHVRSIPGDPRRNRIDVTATLRSAAPWQPLRGGGAGKGDRVRLEMGDIRVKQYRSKAGVLFCLAVDASGSMALHRMQQAKGAVHTLLEQAYVNRDRVALIAFRGEQAELLMPPTQSVELASRALDLLPTGGGTPLASALILACDVAAQARQRGILQTILILLTDGRGNIPLKEGQNPQEELQQLGAYVQESGLRVVVVDTKRNYLSQGEARQLAGWLNADYAYLPNANSTQIAEVAAEARE